MIFSNNLHLITYFFLSKIHIRIYIHYFWIILIRPVSLGGFMSLFSRLSCVRNSVNKFYPHETYFILYMKLLSSLSSFIYVMSTYLMLIKLSWNLHRDCPGWQVRIGPLLRSGTQPHTFSPSCFRVFPKTKQKR